MIMASNVRFSVWMGFVFLLGWIAPSRADDQGDAKAMLQQGKTLIEEEDYEGALAALQESYRLQPKAYVLFNIAMCQKALFLYTEAIASFRQYLDLGETEQELAAEAKMRQMTEAALRDLDMLVGKITIAGAPDEAELTIDDGNAVYLPLRKPLIVDPGPHGVKVTKEGFEPFETEVTIDSGAAIVVRAELTPLGEEMNAEEAGPPLSNLVVTIHPGRVYEVPQTESPWLRLTGWSMVGLGVVSAGVGVYFNIQWSEHYDDATQAAGETNKANEANEYTAWRQKKREYDAAKIKTTNDITGIAIGYGIGGALTVAGAVLLIVDATRSAQDDTVAVVPAPGGVAVQF